MRSISEIVAVSTLGGLAVESISDKVSYLNALIYGLSGVGKTTLAGSADLVPDMRPVLVIDIEGGTLSLRRIAPDVKTVRVETWKQMQQVYDALLVEDHPYQTVILDSLTEIQKFSMYGIMTDLVRNEPDRDPDIPGMREWGKNIEQIRRFVRAFRDLPINTIFTALEVTDKDSRTGKITSKPSLSGKLKDEVSGFLDVVGYLNTQVHEGQLKRYLQTTATDRVVAKDRTGNLPPVMEDPTMERIFSLALSDTLSEVGE